MKKKQEKSLEESNAMVLETWTIDKAVNALTKNNPRIITTKQLTDLRAGIKQFGLLLPPIVNKRTGNWDYDKLADILSTFDESDLAGTGFNAQETEAIVANAINEAENLAFGETQSVDEIRNHSDEEIEQELESTVKVQFGMFSKHIPLSTYEAWVEKLSDLSPNGNSPAALGSVIAEMLNIQVAADEEGTEETGDAQQLEPVET
ncbi:hypothetical protein COO91_03445 [Nostoc flagelliforme CCNUN1]|uniref:Uncharacterized protein n=1 Tax=Nostoc flagelliforme CCNUN1 TaxID=2038116 RepID=A0A2K8SQ79_9NOSO|nr:hypothetical protein [Nostoc flagelliforme]AUB37500.1 hypothetical protein COO91_03445 [Nostoc flagelliforme CCNUN1]